MQKTSRPAPASASEEQQQLINAILQLYVADAELTVEEILDELTEKSHEGEQISRWAFLDDCLREIGLVPCSEEELAQHVRAFVTLVKPDALLLNHPELEHLNPASHVNLTVI